MAEYAVELAGITKRFPGVVANRDIDLRVRSGEVHALCGENGAGKSTLMKILYGHRSGPTRARSRSTASRCTFRSPADAIRAGIGMVHQHFMLADNLTSPRTSCSAREARLGIGAKAKRPDRRAAPTPSGSTTDPDTLVESLGVADRQRVEIIKVLYRGAQTSSWTSRPPCSCRRRSTTCFATLRGMQRRRATRSCSSPTSSTRCARSPTRSR